jgi:hypothetical protein
VPPLGFAERHQLFLQRRRRAVAGQTQILRLDLLAHSQHDSAFHGVLQLADVARPMIIAQRLHGLGRQPLGTPADLPAELFQKLGCQFQHIVAPLA